MENKNIESMHHKFYEWEKKPNFLEELREYFETTSREQILKDWEKTSVYDSGNVTADKFINFLEQRRKLIESTNNVIPADDFILETNELEEDETTKLVNKLLEFQEGLKLYNREFNIFGDDITDYDKDYVIQHIFINKAGYSKCFTWKLSNKEGVFLPEWFDMNLKDVMIKDLHFRRVNLELEIENLQDKIQKIDREIKRYENNSN